ncbi:hypothetical protein [Dactylosporangium sp. NPDC051541]|uniref:hypothetical protein n=1 Tax=Dactylosporangium sp. NPDC051541 TaxID=3363977 RepID=UPI0037BA399B
MKLTVGPLPSGVYWRRRAIVGGVLVAASLMLWASCSGTGGADQQRTPAAASAGAPTSVEPEPSITIQVPTTGGAPADANQTQSVTSAAPPSPVVPPCADADLSLVATPEQAVQFRGAHLKVTLKIKNVTDHECLRDLGPDSMELYLQVAASKVWSSDACDAAHGSKPQPMKPGIEVSFTTTWTGKATNNGCANGEVPPAGKYELVGRLATKFSAPVQVQLT